MPAKKQSHLMVIFTTVFMDLVGFGMIIPLLPIFGEKMGASGWVLGALGASYSVAQFLMSPVWGQVSDRHGRRPVLLMSLTGSTLSYLGFAYATYLGSLPLLFVTRFMAGFFAANISTAQAYIADVTTPEKRAGGMGLIGAAFGIGFIFGPVLGGLSLKHLGELAPGLLAGGICGFNLLLAWARLPESLDPAIQAANRAQARRRYDPLNLGQIRQALSHRYLGLLMVMGFLQVTAFGAMEQVFSLFFKEHLGLSLADAGAKTGYALAYVGVVSAVIQGGLIRRLSPRFGERRLLVSGLLLFTGSIFFMPYGPSYGSYFLILLPLAVGRSFIDPSTSSLISKAVSASEQGRTFGTFQGLNSLARVIGPFVGLTVFATHPALPFLLAGGLCVLVLGLSFVLFRQTRGVAGVDSVQ